MEVSTFHTQNGLFFRRLEDGSVRVIKTKDGRPPTIATEFGGNVVCDETLTIHSFASVVSSMSARGEANGGFYDAMDFLTQVEK
jgi:hypothetical protein